MTTYAPSTAPVPEHEVIVERGSTARDLGPKLNRSAGDVIRFLLLQGEMVTATQSLTDDMIELFAAELGADVRLVDPGEEREAELLAKFFDDDDDEIDEADAAQLFAAHRAMHDARGMLLCVPPLAPYALTRNQYVTPAAAAKARQVAWVTAATPGQPVTLPKTSSIADGLLSVRPGDLTFAHVQALVDDIVTVDEAQIAGAVKWLFDHANVVAEPSGAVTVAAMLAAGVDDASTVGIISGGNVVPEDYARYITGRA